MNPLTTYQSLSGKLSYALFLALLIALPLPRFILQPIAVTWIISWVLELRWITGIKDLRTDGQSHWRLALPGILLVILTLWEALSLLWAPDQAAGLAIINRHWPFIILVLIPLFGFNDLFRGHKLLATLFAAGVVSVPLYLFTSYWVWNADAVIWFDRNALRPFEFPAFHGFTSLMKLRSYYCLILMLSIFSAPVLYRHYCRLYPRWEVLVTLGVGIAVMIVGILMTGSRSALITFVITVVFLLFVGYRKRLRWWAQALIVIGGLALGVGAMVLNPRFSLFTSVDMHHLELGEATNLNEPRLFIWHSVLEHRADYGFFGLGVGQHVPFMMERYREAGNTIFLEQGFGPHSQFFSTWMCLGPLAALLLLAVFFLIPRVFRGPAHYMAHAFAFLYGFSLLSDDLFERMDSILIFLVWMLVLYALETNPENRDTQPVH